jgi:hypothetical protein
LKKEEFERLWSLNYPCTFPIMYWFKHDFKDRWFRIHSLPDSKRYAEDEKEWDILLSRQNGIITDLLGKECPVSLVTGEYYWGDTKQVHVTDENETLLLFSFKHLDIVDFEKTPSNYYDDIGFYRPAFAQTIWNPNEHDKLLKEIAKDNIRAFFVSFEKNVIIAPYDGGIDIVLKDGLTRDLYKAKYHQWLSDRENGY